MLNHSDYMVVTEASWLYSLRWKDCSGKLHVREICKYTMFDLTHNSYSDPVDWPVFTLVINAFQSLHEKLSMCLFHILISTYICADTLAKEVGISGMLCSHVDQTRSKRGVPRNNFLFVQNMIYLYA